MSTGNTTESLKHLYHITIEKVIFSVLNNFQISLKYVSWLFQKCSLYWYYLILVFNSKLREPPNKIIPPPNSIPPTSTNIKILTTIAAKTLLKWRKHDMKKHYAAKNVTAM